MSVWRSHVCLKVTWGYGQKQKKIIPTRRDSYRSGNEVRRIVTTMPTKKRKKTSVLKKNKKTSVFEAPSFYPACFIVPPRKVIYKRFCFHSYNFPLTKKKILPHGQVRSVFCIAVKLRSHLQKLSSLLLRPPVRSVFCIAVTDVMNRSVWGRIFLTYADVCWRMLTYAGVCWQVGLQIYWPFFSVSKHPPDKK